MRTGAARIVRALASTFGCGYIPGISGTVGSAAGLALVWSWPGLKWPLLALTTILGFAIARAAVRAFDDPDPKRFVLDETAGMILSVLFVPAEPMPYLTAFILFRALDTVKPWPIILIQRLGTPASIMWDDLAAGAVTLALTWGAVRIGWI
ncbi:MAG: Phosphatidylglycerophosphatase A [Candidatus Omnitrophica bacterium]|nr:Phosphatidylglycerophosphatase A [Candidatus Omnitrophota bacterium]